GPERMQRESGSLVGQRPGDQLVAFAAHRDRCHLAASRRRELGEVARGHAQRSDRDDRGTRRLPRDRELGAPPFVLLQTRRERRFDQRGELCRVGHRQLAPRERVEMCANALGKLARRTQPLLFHRGNVAPSSACYIVATTAYTITPTRACHTLAGPVAA